MEHQPLPGAMCLACELAYHEDKSSLRLNTWFGAGFLIPWIALVGLYLGNHLPSWSARSGGVRAITTGIPMLDVLIMTTVTAVFAGKLAMGLRSMHHRERFVAVRK